MLLLNTHLLQTAVASLLALGNLNMILLAVAGARDRAAVVERRATVVQDGERVRLLLEEDDEVVVAAPDLERAVKVDCRDELGVRRGRKVDVERGSCVEFTRETEQNGE